MKRLLAAGVLLATLVALDAFWLEPRRLLLRDPVQLGLGAAPPLTLVHLSDLHVARETGLERRLVAAVAAEDPDLILLSGDLVADYQNPRRLLRHSRAAAAVVSQLRRLAPVVGVQGHSEYLGPVVAWLEEAGVAWLSNEGRLLEGRPAPLGVPGGGGDLLLLGLNQQVGRDRFTAPPEPPFTPVLAGDDPAFGRAQPGRDNAYSHYDPAPEALADVGGPLSWSGYEVEVEMRLGEAASEGGIALHSRYPAGEDRMIALTRTGSWPTFALVPHGTAFTAARWDTGVDPEPRRWYRLRLRTEVDGGSVRVSGRVWPAGEPEPETWQVAAEDFSRHQVRAGTVGLWAREGTVAYRRLRVTAADGRVLLEEPFATPRHPQGWRDGPRGSRLELALARSPQVPPGTPRMVLTHVPDAVMEASRMGIEAVLAGHTHGGQIRLPGGIALTTRSYLGPHYDRGLFHFAAPNRRGWTRLYVNSGVGTSLLPVRFFCPPRYAVVEVGDDSRQTQEDDHAF